MQQDLELKISNIPANPGIYQFKDKNGRIIYVGKAKNLRNRVRSYFVSRPVGPRLEKMISLIRDVDIINTDSEAESLILEMNLIKKLRPRYNVNLKDDKSFPYIVVTKELYPRVFPTRRRRSDGSRYFGPYTDVGNMRYSLKMLRDIFMIRNCSLNITQEAIDKMKFKICLEYHIKKCEGPCEGLVPQEKYNEMIGEAVKVLNGKTSTLIRDLDAKMNAASEREDFEAAANMRNKIQALEVYESKQKVVSEDMLDKDIINFVKEQDDACVMILNVRDGKVIGKRHYYLDSVEDNTASELLERVLFKHYSENAFIPDEIYLPEELTSSPTPLLKREESKDSEIKGFVPPISSEERGMESEDDESGISAFQQWFYTLSEKTKIVIPMRGEKVQLLQMVKANAQYMLDELKLQRLKREFIPNSVTALKRDLRLTKLPRRIECFDISHIQGTDTVASMVVFEDGRPRKSDYRKFKLQMILNEVGKPDDFASMSEVIYRRFKNLTPPTTLTSQSVVDLPREESTQKKFYANKPDYPYQTEKARALRKKETMAEKKLWSFLRNRKIMGFKFRRQHPLGYYIVDFYCEGRNAIVEIDGAIHELEQNKEYDKYRQDELETAGYKVIRFTNEQVLNSIDEVIEKVKLLITSPPTPLLKGEGSKKSEITGFIPPLSSEERGTGGEVVDLSFSKLPDLIVIDGGKGQLSSALKVLDDLGIKGQNIIGLAKRLEEVFVPGATEAQSIPKTSSGLKLLQRVRDEAHRFAVTFHRSLRDKRTLKSELEDIKGIGKITSEKLLKQFGSVEKIKDMINNNYAEFESKAGKKTSDNLRKWFAENTQ